MRERETIPQIPPRRRPSPAPLHAKTRLKFEIFQASRIGGRSYNQDRLAYAYTRDALLLVLADGMGGVPGGEVAAQLAVKTCTSRFQEQARAVLQDPPGFLKSALRDIHRAILSYARERHLREVPGTTCVACLVQESRAWWAHAGDSRLYLIRGGRVLARTRDHSLVQELIDEGRLNEEAAALHPDRGILTNCLGGQLAPSIDLALPAALEPGDVLLLASDGLWGPLRDGEIASALAAYPMGEALPRLMGTAEGRAGAGSDNVSALACTWRGEGNGEAGERALIVECEIR